MIEQRPKPGIPIWLFALFFASFAIGTDDFVLAGMLREISHDLDVSEALAGQLVTAFSLTYAVAAPVAAVALARLPRRAVMVGVTLLFALLNVAAAAAPTYGVLMGVRIVAALAAACVTPAAFATAAALAPDGRQGTFIGTIAAGLTTSLVLGVPAGTWIGGQSSWRATMMFVAALAAMAAAGMVTLPRMSAGAKSIVRTRLAPLGRPPILGGLAGTVAAAAGGLMFYTYIGPVAHHASGVESGTLAVLIAVAGVCGIAGTVLGGRLTDLWGPDWTLGGSLALQVAAVAAMAVVAATSEAGTVPAHVIGVVMAIWAVGGWALSPAVQTRLLMLAGDAGTEAAALNSSAMYLGISVAGAAGGTTLAAYGPQGVPWVAAGFGVLALIIFQIAFRFWMRGSRRGVPAIDVPSNRVRH